MSTFSKTAREVEMPNGDIVVIHNAVTENSTSNIKKFKYDDNGHVTESTAANATDLNLNSYSTPTTGSTAIGTSDAVQTAIGKLDHQSQIDQSNILSVEDMVCATEFSSSTAYAVGDMVTYEHKHYKFINAHQGAWSASDVQNYDLTRLQSEDRAGLVECVDGGAKNLLSIEGETREVNGVTATYNSDGSITTSGTATGGNANFTIRTYTPAEAAKLSGLVLSGCPSGGSTNTWRLILQKNSANYDVYAEDTGNGAVVGTVPSVACVLILQIKSGYSKNATWYPMLCTKAAFGVSNKFVPYRPNYDLVYSTLEAQRAQIEYLTPSLKSKRYICSTTDYEQCADVAITVPSGKTIQYTANLKFNNSPPRGVQVRTGTDLTNLNQVVGIQETTQNYGNISVTGLFTNTTSSPVILYIYVKSNSVTSGGNDVVTNVFRLN